MASIDLQILGLVLTLLDWVNALVSCTLPMWKVTAFSSSSITVAQVMWGGAGQMQGVRLDSLLSQNLQVACALCVIPLLVALRGLQVYITGAKCTTCVEDKDVKIRLMLTSGIIFIISGMLAFILTCWTANSIIQDFYSPLVAEAQKKELVPLACCC
ncbi:PREDICTED: claudin-6-like [Elephantulus edwardii]|uniref:claudin-6-like n=1 Tax=Elephantulus edwardii TaxID=28737 RepID=UPI0003F07CAE|nr:PREDICTED: claudin-6-like [Elephantulus edwardii]